ncbi:MAG: long-chain-fatty-acid--CoA ligase [Desulfatiglans sp.]|jgi:acyl-CoA synthetase (AMP-forming)/AMP-acid ligase II|nr:long-chain-fatty-acid--CoA ligase [Thermodesulfobacteriota bacterium]MEE4353164.1 long-chain-fatty-acid--CoA ligase [Desulfatiglans sp.]
MNTTDFLSISSAICPDRDCIVFEGNRWTFVQLNDRINRIANALTGFGVEKGDRVGILNVNCNQYIEIYFACAKLGAIFVPMNFRAKSDELGYMISNAEPKVLFVGNRYIEMVDGLLIQSPAVRECVSIDEKSAGKPFYEDLITSSSSEEVINDIGDEDITILMFTAGTTGRPKGVPLRHSGFAGYILGNVEPANPEIEERNILTVPLYHVAGIQAVMAAIYGGRTMVMMRQFEVSEWLKTVQTEQATRAMLVPTMLKMVIDSPDFKKYDLGSLKVITYGAASMPFEVIKKAIKELPGVNFINAFGQTETASTITMLGPEDHIIEGTEEEQDKKLKRLTSSIGKPLPDVEVIIVDEDGNLLPPLGVGEILAKGPRIMTGYWKDEKKTSQVLTKEGWLRTGDKGWMDEDGYIFLSGRADDMIIRGGENISPEEVENVLYSHPKVEEAAVIGIPDTEWGQVPRAIIVLKEGDAASAEEIMEYCRSELAGFKRPRSVVFIDSLPRSSVGKVLKKEIRKKYGQP